MPLTEKNELPVLNTAPHPGEQRALDRRKMAQLLLAGAAATWEAAAHPMQRHLADKATMAAADAKAAAATWAPEFLSAYQDQTLGVLAERIIPGAGPGAGKAQVNRYIDLLLSVDTRENQQRFSNSLAAFDAEARQRHQKTFRELSEAQQNELLAAAAAQERGSPGRLEGRRTPPRPGEETVLTLRDHFENVKGWVRGAYYSSEVGMRELGWNGEVAWDSFPGCTHPGGHA